MHAPFSQPAPGAAVEALGDVSRAHRRELWHYLRVLGADAATADDLVQDTLLVALRAGFRAIDPTRTRCFLRRTARHRFMAHRRRGRAEQRALEAWCEAVDATWYSDVEPDPWLDALRACRDGLSGRARAAIDLHHGHRLSIAEVARRLGLRAASVPSLLYRARRTLRQCIERRIG